MKALLFALAFLVLIVILGAIYKNPNIINNLKSTNTISSTHTSTQSNKEEMSIKINDTGFYPEVLTIRANSFISFINNTDNNMSIKENINSNYNIGELKPHAKVVKDFKTVGIYFYYLENNPLKRETVIVVE